MLMAQMCKEMLDSKHEQRILLQDQLAASVALSYERKRGGTSGGGNSSAVPREGADRSLASAGSDGIVRNHPRPSTAESKATADLWQDVEDEREEALSEAFLARVMMKVSRCGCE